MTIWGCLMKMQWFSIRIWGSSTKTWRSPTKRLGFRRNLGVSDEQLGVSNENLRFPMKFLGSPMKTWQASADMTVGVSDESGCQAAIQWS